MCKLYFTGFLVFCSLVSVKSNQHDVVVIPISKTSKTFQKMLGYNAAKFAKYQIRKYYNRNTNDFHKLDIEDYNEPTELPDIDNFDNNSGERHINGKERYDYDSLSYGDDKIVGGDEVDISLYPYQVEYGRNCGGAIIDKKWVITAGHCRPVPFIGVGSKYFNKGAKIAVKKNYVHPMWRAKYKKHPFDYDFQLLELEQPLTYNDHIQPVKIAKIRDMVVGKFITVTGWGYTEVNGQHSDVLRAVRVPIISKKKCQNVPYPHYRNTLTSRMFCAGYAEGKKDACQGDSGGPAVSNGRLLGMVSFGYGCATPKSYGVYSNVAKVRFWIENVTGLTLK